MKQLSTVDEVIDALGGKSGCVDRGWAKSRQAVNNWIARGFPPRLHAAMTEELRKAGCSAPDRLWSQSHVDLAESTSR